MLAGSWRTVLVVLLVLVPAVVLSGCSPEPEALPVGQDRPRPVATATGGPLPGPTARDAQPLRSLASATGAVLHLYGVHRLAADQVVVVALLDLGEHRGTPDSRDWSEPGHLPPPAWGHEFAPYVLTVPGDPRRFLPVRDESDRCYCSVIRPELYDQPPTTVMTTMSAPPHVTRVDLEVPGHGTFTSVPVTPLPHSETTVLGTKESLRVTSATRGSGTVTLDVVVTATADARALPFGSHQFTLDQLCFAAVTLFGVQGDPGHERLGGVGTGSTDSCPRGTLPSTAGESVSLQLSLPDPGTPGVVLLPWNGWPVRLTVDGPARQGEGLRTFRARSEDGGAEVSQVRVTLDTRVLFDLDSARLRPEAERALEVAVTRLEAQEGRRLLVTGHTDSQGEQQDNLVLSQARAESVRDALLDRLEEGWQISVEGVGQTQPLAEESGDEEQVEAARARNRRVELTVLPPLAPAGEDASATTAQPGGR